MATLADWRDGSIDEELLAELKRDARASVTKLADRIGRSRASVANRLRQLIERDHVRVVAAVDPLLLGQRIIAHAAISVNGPCSPVVRWLVDQDEAVFVSAVSGANDLVAELRVGSLESLKRLVGEIRGVDGVHSVTTGLYVHVIKGFFMPSEHRDVELDDIDYELIDILQRDGRASFQSLGAAVSLSDSAVRVRVRRLVSSEVIKISVVENRRLAERRVAMGVGVNTSSTGEEAIAFLAAHPAVDFAACTLGRFDLMATIVARSPLALYTFLEELRQVPGVIRTTCWMHLSVEKEKYARAVPMPEGEW